jgi:hypothetical protein
MLLPYVPTSTVLIRLWTDKPRTVLPCELTSLAPLRLRYDSDNPSRRYAYDPDNLSRRYACDPNTAR